MYIIIIIYLDMRSLFIYKIKTFICRCTVVFPTRLQFVQRLFVIYNLQARKMNTWLEFKTQKIK